MPTLRAMRLLNNIESGAIDGAALETALAGDVTNSDFVGLMAASPTATRAVSNLKTITAISGSGRASNITHGTLTSRRAIARDRNALIQFWARPGFNAEFYGDLISGNTTRTLPSSSTWQSVTYGNGVFVAVAYNSTAAATSTDGITWTARTLPSSSNWYSVTYGNGVFVAVASGSTVAATSPDGITWTARTLPSLSNWYSVTYGNGVFVAVANNSTAAAALP